MTTEAGPRRRLTDKQAIAVMVAYFGARQVTTRLALVLLPALSASAPWVLPLLRNTLLTVVAGSTASRGNFGKLASIFAASMVLSMVAGGMLYWVGSRFGPRLAEWSERQGPSSMLSGVWNPKRIARAHRWLDRWGIAAVTLSRLVGALTGPVALVAGSSSMSRTRYAVAQFIGSAVWAAGAIWLGVRAGDAWPWIPERLKSLSALSLRVGLVSFVLLLVFVAIQSGRGPKQEPEAVSERQS